MRLTTGCGPGRYTMRWLHVWCLPALWILAVSILFGITWLVHSQIGKAEIATIAGLPGLWLMQTLNAIGPHPSILTGEEKGTFYF